MIPMTLVHDDLEAFAGNMPNDGVMTLPAFGGEVGYSIDTDDNTMLLTLNGNESGIWLKRKDIKSLRKLLKNLLLEIA